MDKYIFPAVFDPCEEQPGYCITFPDLPGIVTQGDTVEESLAMAKEALELHLFGMEEDSEEIPVPSNPSQLIAPPGGFISLVEASMPIFREKMANKAVNATVTMPRWLKTLAEDRKINFSQVLQSGLKERLGVHEFAPTKSGKKI
ncbi:MAG: hypothetical protein H6Q72_4597 [Firmicutes bacterium]|nr:hypothetical protein [Bacillota bacterium]